MEKRFKSRTELAGIIGIPRRTFSSYNTGQRQVINPDIRKKLYELTGIESFRSEKPNKQEWVQLNEWVNSVVEKPPLAKKDINIIKSEFEYAQVIGCDNIGEMKGTEELKEENENSKTINGNRPFLNMAFELRNWFNNQHKWNTKQDFADSVGIPRSTMKKIFLGVSKPKEEFRQKLYEITQLECFKEIEQKNEKDMKTEDKKLLENDMIEVGKSIEQVGQSIEQVEYSIEQETNRVEPIEKVENEVEVKGPIEHIESENIESEHIESEHIETEHTETEHTETEHIEAEHIEAEHIEAEHIEAEHIETEHIETGDKQSHKSKEKDNINVDIIGDDVEKLTKIFYSLARALEPFKRGTPEQRKRVKEKILPQDLGYVMSFMKAMYDEDSFTDFMFFSDYTLKGGGNDSE